MKEKTSAFAAGAFGVFALLTVILAISGNIGSIGTGLLACAWVALWIADDRKDDGDGKR